LSVCFQVKEGIRLHTSRADSLTLDLRRQEDAAALIQLQHEGLQKQITDCRSQLQESHEKLSKEKTTKQKLEGDNKVMICFLSLHLAIYYLKLSYNPDVI